MKLATPLTRNREDILMDKLKRLIGHTVVAMMIPITYFAEQDVETTKTMMYSKL